MHWGLPDPSVIIGDEGAIRTAFMLLIDRIEAKIDDWINEAQSESILVLTLSKVVRRGFI